MSVLVHNFDLIVNGQMNNLKIGVKLDCPQTACSGSVVFRNIFQTLSVNSETQGRQNIMYMLTKHCTSRKPVLEIESV